MRIIKEQLSKFSGMCELLGKRRVGWGGRGMSEKSWGVNRRVGEY